MSYIKLINNWLTQRYKTPELRPLYRLVWSDNEFEHRKSTYRDYDENKTFIREVTEVRLVKKYPYIESRYIFEKWGPGNLTRSSEIPGSENGDYIPFYVFESGKGVALPVTRKVVEFLISVDHGRVNKDDIPSEEYLEEKETQSQIATMDTHPEWFSTFGNSRNAIAYNKGLKGKEIPQ